MMTELKDQILQFVRDNAARRAAKLAGEYVHAAPEEREAILAGLDFERWLAGACQECLGKPTSR